MAFYHHKTSLFVGRISEVGNPLNSPFSLADGSYSVSASVSLGPGSVQLEMQSAGSKEWKQVMKFDDYSYSKGTVNVTLEQGVYRMATTGGACVYRASIQAA